MSYPDPRTEAGRAGLAAILADPGGALIALDFDGTLAPIVPRPEDARPLAAGLAALTAAAAAFGQVALVTGRPAGWLADVAGVQTIPGLVIAGQYGAQRWTAGRLTESDPAPGLDAVRDALPDVLDGRSAWTEDKGLSLVVHTRAAPDPDAELDAVYDPIRDLAGRHGLEAHRGRAVVEIRPPGFDKGGALRALVSEYDARTVLFAGDDLGDLPAFAAIEDMRAGGLPGLTVCSASTEAPQVADRADLVVDGPQGMAELLAALSAAVT
ncbi:MAG: trehalose-phosphatase [Actinomycetota bacterium]|nr:trehalose-phosphatase [Actinomycetota bacterium]